VSDDPCSRYVRFLETLTPASLDTIGAFVSDDVVFRDPFNDVRGAQAMQRVLRKMFEDLADVRFQVTARAFEPPVAFIAWELTGRTARAPRPLRLEGASQLQFAGDGRVSLHIDHWDAASQLYEQIPLLGLILKRLRQRLASRG
jgi:ketosteroid isomerase-like protein